MTRKIITTFTLCVISLFTFVFVLNIANTSNHGELRLLPKLLVQTQFRPFALDKIYVIALDRAPQRYARIQDQLNKLGMKHEKFKAVDGYELLIEDSWGKKISGKDLKAKKVGLYYGQTYKVLCPSLTINYSPIANENPFGPGALGCECSHREVWNDIIKNNIQYALILEDDAFLTDDFQARLEHMMQNAPIEWDIIYLNLKDVGRQKLSKFINNDSISKIEPNDILLAPAVSYILTNSGAKKALAASQNMTGAIVDTHLSILINNRILNGYKSYHKVNIVKEEQDSVGGSVTDLLGRRVNNEQNK